METHVERLDFFQQKNRSALDGGGEEKIKKHKSGSRLTARERLHVLLDPGELCGIGSFCGSQMHQLQHGQ